MSDEFTPAFTAVEKLYERTRSFAGVARVVGISEDSVARLLGKRKNLATRHPETRLSPKTNARIISWYASTPSQQGK